MKQVLLGGTDAPNTGSLIYTGIQGNNATTTGVDGYCRGITSVSGTLKNFRIVLSAAPGVGKTWTVTIYYDGGATALSVTIANPNTTGSDLTDSIDVQAGKSLYVLINPAGTPAATTMYWSVEFYSKKPFECVCTASTINDLSAALIYVPYVGWRASTSSVDYTYTVTGIKGTIKYMYVTVTVAPGVGNSLTFTLYKNGIAQTLTVTISGANTSGSDLTNSVSVVPGDYLYWKLDGSTGTPTYGGVAFGTLFLSEEENASPFFWVTSSNTSDTLTMWQSLAESGAPWKIVNETFYQSPMANMTFSKLYYKMGSSPGAGNSYILTIRKNKNGSGLVDTALSVTIAGASTTGNDTTHEVDFAVGDYGAVRLYPISTPSVVAGHYFGMKMYCPPDTNLQTRLGLGGYKGKGGRIRHVGNRKMSDTSQLKRIS